MNWEKKICIRITARRLVGAVVMTATAVNLIIVGAAFEAAAPTFTAAPAETSLTTTPSLTNTTLAPTAEATFAWTQPPGLTPTDTLLPTQAPTDAPLWIVCVKRFYWPTYRIQYGDSLVSIAAGTGATTQELMAANCLTTEQIDAGQLLFVPRPPGNIITNAPADTPTATPTDTPTATATPSATYTATSTNTQTETSSVTPSYTPTYTPPPPTTDTPTATSSSPADLVVVYLQVTGPAAILLEQKTIAVPIHVLIQNQGGTDAEIFKLSAHYAGLGAKLVAPFAVSGQADNWYPYNTTPLAAGHEVTFTGTVSLPMTLQGQTIALSVLADSCSGDENMPDYCRVFESNEGNNESQPIGIDLPSNNPPSVSITIPAADTNGAFDNDPQNTNYWSAVVDLSGSAMDREDGVLTGASLVWSTDRTDLEMYRNNGILGTGTSISPTLYVYVNDCRGHIITLTATDSDGNVAIATKKIGVGCLNSALSN